VVDGVDVLVRTETVWLESASPVPAIVGALLGAGLALALWKRREWVLLGAAVLATGVGAVQYRSVPSLTGPTALMWALPLTALLAAVVAVTVRSPWVRLGAMWIGGAELVVWAFQRRAGFTAALLPTDAPFWLDRAITGLAGAAGLVALVFALARLVELVTRPPQSAA